MLIGNKVPHHARHIPAAAEQHISTQNRESYMSKAHQGLSVAESLASSGLRSGSGKLTRSPADR